MTLELIKRTDRPDGPEHDITPEEQSSDAQKIMDAINGLGSGVVYRGLWNAATNSPALASGVGDQGDAWIVGVAGTTSLNGTATWAVGDEVRFNGTVWQRNPIGGAKVTSFKGRTGTVVPQGGDYTAAQIEETDAAKILTAGERAAIAAHGSAIAAQGTAIGSLGGAVSSLDDRVEALENEPDGGGVGGASTFADVSGNPYSAHTLAPGRTLAYYMENDGEVRGEFFDLRSVSTGDFGPSIQDMAEASAGLKGIKARLKGGTFFVGDTPKMRTGLELCGSGDKQTILKAELSDNIPEIIGAEENSTDLILRNLAICNGKAQGVGVTLAKGVKRVKLIDVHISGRTPLDARSLPQEYDGRAVFLDDQQIHDVLAYRCSFSHVCYAVAVVMRYPDDFPGGAGTLVLANGITDIRLVSCIGDYIGGIFFTLDGGSGVRDSSGEPLIRGALMTDCWVRVPAGVMVKHYPNPSDPLVASPEGFVFAAANAADWEVHHNRYMEARTQVGHFEDGCRRGRFSDNKRILLGPTAEGGGTRSLFHFKGHNTTLIKQIEILRNEGKAPLSGDRGLNMLVSYSDGGVLQNDIPYERVLIEGNDFEVGDLAYAIGASKSGFMDIRCRKNTARGGVRSFKHAGKSEGVVFEDNTSIAPTGRTVEIDAGVAPARWDGMVSRLPGVKALQNNSTSERQVIKGLRATLAALTGTTSDAGWTGFKTGLFIGPDMRGYAGDVYIDVLARNGSGVLLPAIFAHEIFDVRHTGQQLSATWKSGRRQGLNVPADLAPATINTDGDTPFGPTDSFRIDDNRFCLRLGTDAADASIFEVTLEFRGELLF